MKPTESAIRDKLALNLGVLEEGLQLLDIEKYIPNQQGTKGFIDLLARDKNDKYVIIELKRSNSASRDALHEVLKYIEGLKSNFSLRDSELRVFIVSTEWKELMVPFSSFVKRTSIVTLGFSLEIDSNYVPVRSTQVQPIELSQDRLFAPWHELNLYESESLLEKGIASYEKSCAAKSIKNYVLLTIIPSVEFSKRPGRTLALMQAFKTKPELLRKSPEEILADLPTYSYILYFAPLQLSEETCWHIIRNITGGECLEEFEIYISSLEESSRLCALHEKVYELNPAISYDNAEIGTPAKFKRLMDGKGAKILQLRRYGTLESNKFLSDDSIIGDLRGFDGNHLQMYHKEFSPSNRAELAEVCNSVQHCLRDNPLWRAQIQRILNEFLPQDTNCKATLHIYNPSNFCLSLYKHIDEPGGNYIPGYVFFIEKNNLPYCIYFGKLWPTGKPASFTYLLNTFYEGSGLLFLSNLNWGGYESRDVEITEALGMTYKTFKVDIDGDNRRFWELTDINWKTCAPFNQESGIREFIRDNKDFVHDICDYYATHWDGVLMQHDSDELFIPST